MLSKHSTACLHDRQISIMRLPCLNNRLHQGMWLFPPQRGEIQPFSPAFPSAESISQGILLVIPLELQGKSINRFL